MNEIELWKLVIPVLVFVYIILYIISSRKLKKEIQGIIDRNERRQKLEEYLIENDPELKKAIYNPNCI